MLRKIIIVIILILAMMPGAASATEDPLRVYVAPNGSTSNTGLSAVSPVATLEQAEQVILRENPDSDVEVRIAPGTYTAGETIWTTYLYGHTITFAPQDYVIGAARPAHVPMFQSDGSIGYWLKAQLTSTDQGGSTGLRLYYLDVSGYANGLAFWGSTSSHDGIRRPARLGMNDNLVYGMRFTDIGNQHNPTMYGYGALTIQNSDRNYIRNNHFAGIENIPEDAQIIHAIYMAHGADENMIVHNRFTDVNGSPIRVRNQSDDNHVTGNYFVRTGTYPIGFYSEWFCGVDCQNQYDQVPECSSHGNEFYANTLGTAYTGGYLPMWYRQPNDLSEVGPEGCPRDSRPWLRTYDNVRTD